MTDTAAMIGINSDVPTPARDTRQNLVGMSHTEILDALAAFNVER